MDNRHWTMRILLRPFLFALLLLLPISALAQDNEEWPSLSYLRSDYRSVSAVAHVKVSDAEIVSRIPGYENWRIVCEIIEPFKGKFQKGQTVEFFHGAEAGFRKELFLGEKIVFLLHEFDEKEKKRRYVVLENSTLPYTQDRVLKLRTIRRSARHKPAKTR